MTLADIVLPVALLIVLCMSAFFSGVETGLISLDRVILKQREETGDENAVILRKLLRKPETVLTTILLGNNLVNVTATIVFLLWAVRIWGSQKGGILTPVILTPFILIFCEILPKAIFRHKADVLTLALASPLRTIMFLFAPAVAVITSVISKVMTFLGGNGKRSPFISREDVRLMFIDDEGGIIEKDERAMIHGVIDLGTMAVREIVVPRIDMVAVRDDTAWEEIMQIFESSGHSRLPVYHEKIDDIVGIIYVYDIMRTGKSPLEHSIHEYLRPAAFVPESKKVHDLLHELRQKQMFMAIVVDEYGGTAGLVTLEDLIEEIFGEIHDEYDVKRLPLVNAGEGLFVFDGRMHRDEAEELLGLELPKGEYETVGGFILEQLRRIPRKGESFQFNGFKVTVLESTERSVAKVEFKRHPLTTKIKPKKKT